MANGNSGWSWCPGHVSSDAVHLACGRKKGKQPVLLRNILDDLSNELIFAIPCPSVRLLRVSVVLNPMPECEASQGLCGPIIPTPECEASQRLCGPTAPRPSVRLLRVSVVDVPYAHGVFPPSRARQRVGGKAQARCGAAGCTGAAHRAPLSQNSKDAHSDFDTWHKFS